MSLTTCLKKAGDLITAEDKAAIHKAARAYRGEGMKATEAARRAVDDRIVFVRGLLEKASSAGISEAASPQGEELGDQPAAELDQAKGAPAGQSGERALTGSDQPFTGAAPDVEGRGATPSSSTLAEPTRSRQGQGAGDASLPGVAASRSPIKSVEANITRGREAMNKAIVEKADQGRAMFREGIGWIDFVWGDDKRGLQHIIAQRTTKDGMSREQATRLLTEDIVETIASGTEVRRREVSGAVNLWVEANGKRAVLVRRPGSNGWLLTGFEMVPGERGVGFDTSSPTLSTPTVTRRGEGAGTEESVPPALNQRTKAIRALADAIAARWKNAPNVVVVQSMEDPEVPPDARDMDQRSESAAGAMEGFFHGESRTVYLVAEQLPGDADVVRVLMHESLGHFGLRGVFGPALDPILDRVALLNEGRVRAKAKQYGLDYAKRDDRRAAAEEVLAEIAQATPDVSLVKRAVAAIRSWLREHVPGFERMELSDAEIIRDYIIPAREFVQRGGPNAFAETQPAVHFSRASTRSLPTAGPGNSITVTTTPSRWFDATGRLQFAPGQVLYDLIGKAANPLLVLTGMKAASPELRRQLRQMKLDVQKAQDVALEVARETHKLSADERAMVSDIIEKELKAGTIPPAHAIRLAALMNQTMQAQSAELVRLGMLTKEAADRWDGAYLPRFYESKLRAKAADVWATALQKTLGRTSIMRGIKGKHLKGRGLYETINPAELQNWQALGWEVRDPDFDPATSTEVQVWRDFTREEREKMGEIRDAGFRFVMGYMQTQRDIALGRMFEAMAADPKMSSRLEKPGWVPVPKTVVPGTGALRYGKLSGRFVPTEVLSHLTQIEEAQSEAWKMYRKALSLWKEGKTALNPVSHVNNVLSNLTMAHFAGISYHRADKYIAAIADFTRGAPMVKEARDAGLFLGTLSDAELMNTLPKELRELAQQAEGQVHRGARFVYNAMSLFLRKPLGAAYQAEDVFFRYLIYRDARKRGVPPQDAVDYAQKFIFTYDDLPRGARFVRDFGIPFFAYTYKAVPALLHTALTHPVRFAAPAGVLWASNAAMYAIAAGDEEGDEWDEALRRYLEDPEFRARVREKEQLERQYLPPWMKGTTSLGTPKAIRLGMDEVTNLPLFIDVARIVPGGDMFDVAPNSGGLPLPQPITPSHPIFTVGVAMFANKDLYFGKEIVDENDTSAEAAEKRASWLWRQVSPALAIGNYHFERGMNALAQASGGEIDWLPEGISERYTGIGRDGLPVQPGLAAAQTFGIKVRPIDLDLSAKIDASMRDKMIRDIDAEVRRLRRLNSTGAVSDSVYEHERERAAVKKERLREGLTVDGDARH